MNISGRSICVETVFSFMENDFKEMTSYYFVYEKNQATHCIAIIFLSLMTTGLNHNFIDITLAKSNL